MRCDLLRAEKCAFDVDIEQRVPVLLDDLQRRLCKAQTGIVHQHEVSRLVLGQAVDRLRKRVDVGQSADVGCDNLGPAAARGDRLSYRLELVLPPARQHDECAGAGKTFGEDAPDAFARPGYDDQPIVEAEGGERIVVCDIVHAVRFPRRRIVPHPYELRAPKMFAWQSEAAAPNPRVA
jgi:hypothetical protein